MNNHTDIMTDSHVLYQATLEQIKVANNIAIITHINPDGDCTCSALALRELIKAMGKDAHLYNEQGCPSFLEFMAGDAQFNPYTEETAPEYDLVIFVDCGGRDRAGKVEWVCNHANKIINIDHHSTNPMFGDINIVDGDACATGVMIYEMYQSLGLELNKNIASFLYVAIMMDTGNFSYSNADKRAHYVAGELLDYGVEVSTLCQKFRTTSYNKLKLTALAYETLKLYENGKIAVINVTKAMYNQTGTTSEDSESFVGTIRDIKGVQVAVLLRDTTDGKLVKVSLRSNNSVDVSKIAQFYGGGGHFAAAGCSIEGKIPQVEEMVVNKVSEYIN